MEGLPVRLLGKLSVSLLKLSLPLPLGTGLSWVDSAKYLYPQARAYATKKGFFPK
jgi:hypothetical protein